MDEQVTRGHDSRALSIGSFAVAVVAMLLAGALVLTRNDNKSSADSSVTALTTIEVSLKEMSITPAEITMPLEGAKLHISNVGASVHSFHIEGLNVSTPDIQPGDDLTVTVHPSGEGTYEMWCMVAGHKEAGMQGIVMVGSGAGTSGGQSTHTMSDAEMNATMLAVAQKFPAKTEGHGGDRLEPTVLADGTKEFDLTAEVVKWEVEPGKLVDAWTYNGVVPAPEIHVNVGDKVKLVLTNNLPESTSLHLHGIRVPNSMDGVDPYTQDPILPGASFAYEFTALEDAVGIYHSHHDAQIQVPNGMFGAFTIGDPVIPDVLKEKGFTQIDKSVNMVLNDAGTIGLTLNGKSFPATEPYTMRVGQVMLVNYFNEGLLGHPMHLHQPHGWIIEKDGVPLLVPIPGDTIWVGPGERYTVIYKATDPGTWAWHCHILTHAETSKGMFGMVTALIVTP